jgi:hypothetical protein
MADYSFEYPEILTNKAWQKHKGVVAKLAVGKTDVGAALSTFEDEFGRSGFGHVKSFGGLDPMEFHDFHAGLIAGLKGSAKQLNAKAMDALKVAAAARDAFSASKMVPKSSTQYVKDVMAALGKFNRALDPYVAKVDGDLKKEFREKLQNSTPFKLLQINATTADVKWKQTIELVKKVEKTPTLAFFHQTFGHDGPHRSVGNWSKTWDQVLRKDMPRLATSIYPGKGSDYFELPCINKVSDEMSGHGSNEIQELIDSGQDEGRAVKTYLLKYSSSLVKTRELIAHLNTALKRVQAV